MVKIQHIQFRHSMEVNFTQYSYNYSSSRNSEAKWLNIDAPSVVEINSHRKSWHPAEWHHVHHQRNNAFNANSLAVSLVKHPPTSHETSWSWKQSRLQTMAHNEWPLHVDVFDHTPIRLILWKPIWLDRTPLNTKNRWKKSGDRPMWSTEPLCCPVLSDFRTSNFLVAPGH